MAKATPSGPTPTELKNAFKSVFKTPQLVAVAIDPSGDIYFSFQGADTPYKLNDFAKGTETRKSLEPFVYIVEELLFQNNEESAAQDGVAG